MLYKWFWLDDFNQVIGHWSWWSQLLGLFQLSVNLLGLISWYIILKQDTHHAHRLCYTGADTGESKGSAPPLFTENYSWFLQPFGPGPRPPPFGPGTPPPLFEIQTFSLGYIYLIHMKPPLKKWGSSLGVYSHMLCYQILLMTLPLSHGSWAHCSPLAGQCSQHAQLILFKLVL